MPAPPLVAFTDAQITTVMQLSRPLLPAQRVAFVELLVARINGRREIGEICRELQRQVLGAARAA